MKTFRVIVTDDAKADLKKYRDYILKRFKNPQAARDLILDFRKNKTANSRRNLADAGIESITAARTEKNQFHKS